MNEVANGFAYPLAHSVILWNVRTMEMTRAIKILSVMAHEGRLSLLQALVRAGEDGLAVGRLAAAQGHNVKTVSAQLQRFADAGLVGVRREGKQVIYVAEYATLSSLISFVMHECCGGHEDLRRTVRKACGC